MTTFDDILKFRPNLNLDEIEEAPDPVLRAGSKRKREEGAAKEEEEDERTRALRLMEADDAAGTAFDASQLKRLLLTFQRKVRSPPCIPGVCGR